MAGPETLGARNFSNQKGVNILAAEDPTDVPSYQQVLNAIATAESRANHTGTQTASTISDFDTRVRQSRLDQLAAPTSPVVFNTQRASNIAAATTDSDAPNWGQVKDLISGQRKTDAIAVATGNITLSGTQTIDGVTVAAGQRVLVVGQTVGSANGIYVVAAGAWSRATDADVSGEFATGWLITVEQGTVNADTLWKHDTDGAVTVGTTTIVFTKIGSVATTVVDGYTATCPATAAGNTWTVNHGLGTKFIVAQVARVASPFDYVDVRIERTDANNLAVKPDIALTAGQYEIMVKKVA